MVPSQPQGVTGKSQEPSHRGTTSQLRHGLRVPMALPAAQNNGEWRTMKFRLLNLMLVGAFVFSACATSDSGEAPEPVVSGQGSASAAGLAALSTGSIDPVTCAGVLGSPPVTHTLELQSLTDTGQAGSPQVDSMCAAVYETSSPGDPFLTVALINFDSGGAAAAHYDLLKGAFVAQGIAISEVNSADEGLMDSVSALIDTDGIGRTTVFRGESWVLTVSVGPTTEDSLWTTADLQVIGESILGRAQS